MKQKFSTLTHGEILEEELEQATAELRRPASGLLLSGFSAGLDLGFSVLAMGAVLNLVDLPGGAIDLLLASAYSLGFVGAGLFAALAGILGPDLGIVDAEDLGQLARRMSDHGALTILGSAVLAGWLMGLLSWLVAAGRDTVGQILIVWLVTGTIGLLGLHHSIVGTVEVLSGVLTHEGVTWGEFGRFLLFATIGNAIGGVVFVAVIKHGHSIRDGN